MHKTSQILHITPPAEWYIKTAGAYEAPQGKDFPLHHHTTWELVYYRSGQILCQVGDDYYQSEPGMILLTPPYTLHSEQATMAYTNFFVAIDVPAEYPWPRILLDDQKRTFEHIFDAMVYEWRGQSFERERLLGLLVSQLDILLRRMHATQQLPEAEKLVRQVESLIAERFHTSITIKEIAQEVGVSPSYLRTQFAQLRGYSPMHTLQAIRLREAIRLLENSSSNLESIATMCGYDSASHLSRYIRRSTGKSPGMLRKRQKL